MDFHINPSFRCTFYIYSIVELPHKPNFSQQIRHIPYNIWLRQTGGKQMKPIQNKIESITIRFNILDTGCYKYTADTVKRWFDGRYLLPFKHDSIYRWPFFNYTIENYSLLPDRTGIIFINFPKYPRNKIDDFDFLNMMGNFLSYMDKHHKDYSGSAYIRMAGVCILYNDCRDYTINRKFF